MFQSFFRRYKISTFIFFAQIIFSFSACTILVIVPLSATIKSLRFVHNQMTDRKRICTFRYFFVNLLPKSQYH